MAGPTRPSTTPDDTSESSHDQRLRTGPLPHRSTEAASARRGSHSFGTGLPTPPFDGPQVSNTPPAGTQERIGNLRSGMVRGGVGKPTHSNAVGRPAVRAECGVRRSAHNRVNCEPRRVSSRASSFARGLTASGSQLERSRTLRKWAYISSCTHFASVLNAPDLARCVNLPRQPPATPLLPLEFPATSFLLR